MKIAHPVREDQWFNLLSSLANEYKGEIPGNIYTDIKSKEEFLTMLKERWKINLKFVNDDIDGNIEEVDIEDEYYTALILKYMK